MDSLPPPGLARKNVHVRALLGDRFFINLGTMLGSKPCKKFIETLRSRDSFAQDLISCRVINHWESQGLIECERNNNTGWRKFNLIEYIWLRLVQKLRDFGFPINKIAEIKEFYFEKEKKKSEVGKISYVTFYLTTARLLQQPVFFVILLNENQAEFLDYHEFQAAIDLNILGSYICINLNDILNTVFTKKIEPIYPVSRPISLNMHDTLDILESGDYDIATIYKKGKNFQKVELDKYFDGSESDETISEDYENIDIIKKRRKGELVMKKRKIIQELAP